MGRCGLLTLTGTRPPPVTAFWYPGFLPANAFAVTGDGLVWTIDHLPVAVPGPGAAAGPRPLLWHTNHSRYVPGAEPSAGGTSAARGEALNALAVPAEDPVDPEASR